MAKRNSSEAHLAPISTIPEYSDRIHEIYRRRVLLTETEILQCAFGGTGEMYRRDEDDCVVVGSYGGSEVKFPIQGFEEALCRHIGPHIPREYLPPKV